MSTYLSRRGTRRDEIFRRFKMLSSGLRIKMSDDESVETQCGFGQAVVLALVDTALTRRMIPATKNDPQNVRFVHR